MKKAFCTILLLGILLFNADCMAYSAMFSGSKNTVKQGQISKNDYKEIVQVFQRQDEFAKKYDIEGIKTVYSKDFINSDGFNRDIYFSLIDETWQTYSDITYKTKINEVNVEGNFASVSTTETAVATTSKNLETGAIYGELRASSECIYSLKKVGDAWLISAEQVLRETSALKFGDARYIKMTFDAPKVVGAGMPYSSTIKVHAPSNLVVVGSLDQARIVNPAEEPDEKFRPFSDELTLTRFFTANEDNLNEYNVASVAIANAEPLSDGSVKMYISGLAFVMTRINVVPKNNFAKVKDNNEQENQ